MELNTYATSLETKKELCAAAKQLMQQKPLEKITIREITDICHIKRQTFYYHFEDIYDLVHWILDEEAVSLLKKYQGALLWQEGLLELLNYLQDNKEICLCVLNSPAHDYLRRFFKTDIIAIFHLAIEQYFKQMPNAQKKETLFIQLYSASLSGIIECWLRDELSCTSSELVAMIDELLQQHISAIKTL